MVNGALMAVAVLAFVFAADVDSLLRGDVAAEQASFECVTAPAVAAQATCPATAQYSTAFA